jgi:Na+/melibiose symporter-like transporter|tara:strand:+ start:2853 stop:3104 length:252 start_codon:yes stop_codon:yes gene_type:complete
MGLEGYIILIVIVIIFFIWSFSSNESEKREISNESQNLEQKLNKIESQIKELTIKPTLFTKMPMTLWIVWSIFNFTPLYNYIF